MLFFDTYALLELINGNKNYKRFLEEEFVTTKLNLMEMYHALLRMKNKNADYYYDFFLPSCVPIPDTIIKAAMKFKLQHKNLSYADCIGYALALLNDIKFLTGDEHFRNMKNVEFVK